MTSPRECRAEGWARQCSAAMMETRSSVRLHWRSRTSRGVGLDQPVRASRSRFAAKTAVRT